MTDQLTIEITTDHCLGGEGNDVCAGQVMVAPRDLPIAEAMRKVRIGYARVIPNADAAGPEARDAREVSRGPAATEHNDPVPDTRDPIDGARMAPKGRPRAGGR